MLASSWWRFSQMHPTTGRMVAAAQSGATAPSPEPSAALRQPSSAGEALQVVDSPSSLVHPRGSNSEFLRRYVFVPAAAQAKLFVPLLRDCAREGREVAGKWFTVMDVEEAIRLSGVFHDLQAL